MYNSPNDREYLKKAVTFTIELMTPIVHEVQKELLHTLKRKQNQSDREKSMVKNTGWFDNDAIKDSFFSQKLGKQQWDRIKEEKKLFSEEICHDRRLDKIQLDAIMLGLMNFKDGVFDNILIPFHEKETFIKLHSVEELLTYLNICGFEEITDLLQKHLLFIARENVLRRRVPKPSPEKKRFQNFVKLANKSIVQPLLATRQTQFEEEHTPEAIEAILSIEEELIMQNIKKLQSTLDDLTEDQIPEHAPLIQQQIRTYTQLYKLSAEKKLDEKNAVMNAVDILHSFNSMFTLIAKRGQQFSFMGETYKNEYDIFELCQTLLAKYEKSHNTPRQYLEGLYALKKLLPPLEDMKELATDQTKNT